MVLKIMIMAVATISADPRFRLARSLLSNNCEENEEGQDEQDEGGGIDAAIEIFAALLEEVRTTQGDNCVNAALCQFEYGNALFRATVRRTPLDKNNCNDNNERGDILDGDYRDSKPAAKLDGQREIIAAAAMKRSAADDYDSIPMPTKRVKIETDDSLAIDNGACSKDVGLTAETDDNDDDDLALALEMMDTSWSILLSHITTESPKNNELSVLDDKSRENQQWAKEQIPRVIRCIGDLYFFREEFADAVDMYLRAMQYREEAWDRLKQFSDQNSSSEVNDLEKLQCQRLLVETYALIAEALLSCPNDGDVVCHRSDENENDGKSAFEANAQSTKKTILVKAMDRVEYAQSYYDMARAGLEEVLCRYGKMAASNVDLRNEKEDIGYLVMSIVGVGNSLSEQK